jgi:hypothetical protein
MRRAVNEIHCDLHDVFTETTNARHVALVESFAGGHDADGTAFGVDVGAFREVEELAIFRDDNDQIGRQRTNWRSHV